MAKAKKEIWRNRKIETKRMRVGDVLPHPMNPKIHPEKQNAPLRSLLETVGKLDDLKAFYSAEHGGKLMFFDGHGRQSLNPSEEWDIDIYDLTDDEARLAIASFDPIGWEAEQSRERLSLLLQEVSTGDAELQKLITGIAEKTGVIPPQSADDLWRGMPVYNQENVEGRIITVHFETEADVEKFAQRMEQTITDKTRSIWFPYKAPESFKHIVVEDES